MPSPAPERFRLPLAAPQAVREVDAVLWQPAVVPGGAGVAGVVLGHGAGSDITNPTLCGVARGLAEAGHPVLTFNFAYSQAGRKRPDPPARLLAAFRDAVAAARERMGGRPLLLGGRSMGGRIASMVAAQGLVCDGLVLLGYPLHPAGRPAQLRTAHWRDLSVPALFVQGDRDALCDLGLFERERAARLAHVPTTVHVLAGADHAFSVRRRDGRSPAEVLDEVVSTVVDWSAAVGTPA